MSQCRLSPCSGLPQNKVILGKIEAVENSLNTHFKEIVPETILCYDSEYLELIQHHCGKIIPHSYILGEICL